MIGSLEIGEKKNEKLEELIKEDIAEPEGGKNNLLYERFYGQKKTEFKTFDYKDTCVYSTVLLFILSYINMLIIKIGL